MSPANPHDLGADGAFSTAFALGWETALLFFRSSFDSLRGEEQECDGLPGLISLPPPARTRIAVDLVEAKLGKLAPRLTAVAPLDPNGIKCLREALDADPEESARKKAVEQFHNGVLRSLTTAELRLGRAYGLGHSLAETWLLPSDDESFRRAFGVRLIAIKDWLSDLSSSFPPHASRAVVLSLRAWEKWAANPEIRTQPLDWNRHGAAVREALQRQGELWRDLLADDKRGEDMLDTEHYLRAANSLIGKMTSTIRGVLGRLMRPLLIAGITLGVGILVLLFLSGTAAKVGGAVLTGLGALGITGAGLRARLGKVAGDLQSRLWGAELDQAIAEAVLIGPQGWGATVKEIAVPPTGTDPKVAENMATLERLRRLVERGRRRKLDGLLAERGLEFRPNGAEVLSSRGEIVAFLLAEENQSRFAAMPEEVEAAPSGALITHRKDAIEVWRIQEKKVVRWATCDNAKDARSVAEKIIL